MLHAAFAVAMGLFAYGALSDAASLAPGARLNLGSVPARVYDAFDTTLFLAGMIVACMPAVPRGDVRVSGILAGGLCLAYFATKYAMVVKGWGAAFYPVLFVLVGSVSLLAIRVFGDPHVIRRLKSIPWLAWIIDLVSGLTLEIYVVHQLLISTFAGLARVPFPVNIILLVLISVAGAAVLRTVTGPLRRWVDKVTQPATTTA